MKTYILAIVLLIFSNLAKAQQEWQLAIQTWTFHTNTLYESIDKADSLDVRAIEVYPGQKVGRDIKGAFSFTLDKPSRDKLIQYLASKRIKVVALGVVDKYYYNERNLEQFFEFAQYMGIPFITAEPEWEDLDEFNRLAEIYGIKVALHCHPKPSSHYWHPDSMILAMQGRKHIGAWPDIGHWVRSGIQPLEGLIKIKGRVWGMHLKDVRAFDNVNAEDTLLGKGVTGMETLLGELKKQGFSGVVALEYEMHPENNMEAMRENISYYYQQVKDLQMKK